MTAEVRNTTTETETEISSGVEAETGQEKNIQEGSAPVPAPAPVREAGGKETQIVTAGVGQKNTQDSAGTGVRVTRVGGL